MPTLNTLTAPATQPTPVKQAPSYANYAAARAALENQSVDDFIGLLTDIHADLNTTPH